MTETSTATIVTFLAYIAGVFVLAGLSHRLLAKKSFMGEYFLGSRGLGSWRAKNDTSTNKVKSRIRFIVTFFQVGLGGEETI